MTMFLIQSAILIAIAFVAGCIIGCLLRRMFAAEAVVPAAVTLPATSVAQSMTPEPQAAKPVDAAPAPVMATEVAAMKPKPAPKPKSALKPEVAGKPASSANKAPAKPARPARRKPDNLTLINGIGNVIEKKLHGIGVFHFEQIARWTNGEAEEASRAVGFPGRALRENWMKEAAILMKGGTTDHARKVEAGEVATSRKSTATRKGRKK